MVCTFVWGLRGPVYANVKVPQVVFMRYSTDPRDTVPAKVNFDLAFRRRGGLYVRFCHKALSLFDDSLRQRHDGSVEYLRAQTDKQR